MLVENGAGLETWLDRLLRDAGARDLHVVVCADGLPVKNLNPHLWMDPVLAKQYVLKIRDALIAVDPAHAAEYRRNAASYNARLDELIEQIRKQIATIPPSHRYMIVFHNAWQYYNDRFGIATLGFVERNPGQEPNPQQIAQLIDLAKQHHVHGVFSEPEYSPKLLYSIAQGAGIKVVENLYDDSVGTDPRVANYIAMLTYDTDVIVQDAEVTRHRRAQGDRRGGGARSGRALRGFYRTARRDVDGALRRSARHRRAERLGKVDAAQERSPASCCRRAGSCACWVRSRASLPPGTIAYVPQVEAVDWSFPATVWDVVAMGRFSRLQFWQHFGDARSRGRSPRARGR